MYESYYESYNDGLVIQPDVITEKQDQFISELCGEFEKNNSIDPTKYVKFDVKRGLRNDDGTGVRAGLTLISNVHGYVVSEGEKTPIDGILTYRGINICDIVHACANENRFSFEETAWLLLFGNLPDSAQYQKILDTLCEFRTLPREFSEDIILKSPSKNLMNSLSRCVLSLYSYDENPDIITLHNILTQSIKLIARTPVMIAQAFVVKRHYFDDESLYFHPLDKSHSTAECLLSLIRPDRIFTDAEAKLLDIILTLHMEHGGGNNSTFATRVLTSADTDTYSAISAGIGSLKGFKHGGANIKVMEMFECIKKNVGNWDDEEEIYQFLTRIIGKEAFDKSGLVYGMGHAVYTKSDPRAILLKESAKKLAAGTPFEKEMRLLESIEKLTPDAFRKIRGIDKTICANVDLYSGLVYKMLGIPEELYTPLFAVARMVGWCAHRIEEKIFGGKIIRPAYKSLAKEKAYVKITDR